MTATAVRSEMLGSVGDVVVTRPRRRRTPEAVVGALLMVGCGLGGVLVYLGASHKEPVLAAARPIAAGETIDAADLRIVYLAADSPVAHVARDQARGLVGKTAAADVPVGGLLTLASVRASSALTATDGVVAVALDAGGAPPTVRRGDVVDVVSSADGGDGGVVVAGAEVVDVSSGDGGRVVVSVRTDRDAAARVASFPPGAVRLVVVGR